MFHGTHELSLDSKGRLAFPVDVRAQIDRMGGGVVITRHSPEPCLRVYPLSVWPKVLRFYSQLPRKYDRWRRLVIGSASTAQLDSAGRVLISPVLRRSLGLDRTVHLVGDMSRLEIWDAATHEREMSDTAELDLPAALADMRDPSDMDDDDPMLDLDPSAGVPIESVARSAAADDPSPDISSLPGDDD